MSDIYVYIFKSISPRTYRFVVAKKIFMSYRFRTYLVKLSCEFENINLGNLYKYAIEFLIKDLK